MTTLTAVDDRYPSGGAAASSGVDRGPGGTAETSGSGLWITLSVTLLVVATFLLAGYFEYIAAAAAGGPDAGLPGLLRTREFLGGALRTGMTAFGVGLGPLLVLRALPGVRVRSPRGPLALFAAGVATVLCITGLLITLG